MRIAPVFLLSFLLGSCTIAPKITTVQPDDNRLSCSQLEAQFRKLDRAEEKAKAKKGTTPLNIAAVILSLPALYFIHNDIAQSLKSIFERRAHLKKIFNKKDCS